MGRSNNSQENRAKGYVALFRSIQDHWLYPNDRELTEYEAWLDLLLQANHKSRKVRIKNKILLCGRGESIRSIQEWSDRWNWSRSKVYRFLGLLKEDGMIETVSETVTTRITICNYESYQTPKEKSETETKQERNASETEVKQGRNASETASDTNKNDNNGNNDENGENGESGRSLPQPPTLEECVDYFKQNGGLEDWAYKFWNHYTHKTQPWTTDKGNRFDWRVKALKWITEDREQTGIDPPPPLKKQYQDGGINY